MGRLIQADQYVIQGERLVLGRGPASHRRTGSLRDAGVALLPQTVRENPADRPVVLDAVVANAREVAPRDVHRDVVGVVPCLPRPKAVLDVVAAEVANPHPVGRDHPEAGRVVVVVVVLPRSAVVGLSLQPAAFNARPGGRAAVAEREDARRGLGEIWIGGARDACQIVGRVIGRRVHDPGRGEHGTRSKGASRAVAVGETRVSENGDLGRRGRARAQDRHERRSEDDPA